MFCVRFSGCWVEIAAGGFGLVFVGLGISGLYWMFGFSVDRILVEMVAFRVFGLVRSGFLDFW